MGMYTEFFFRAELVRDTPEEVITTLRYMVGDVEDMSSPPKHPFFSTDRWSFMLRGNSAYHPATGAASLHIGAWGYSHPYYELKAHSSFKNYDNEIELFLDWIDPYLADEGFLGYSLYECDETPALYYKTEGA